MKILITGAAGFIGSAVCQKLKKKAKSIVGIDSLNSYYSPKLKKLLLNIKNIFEISGVLILNFLSGAPHLGQAFAWSEIFTLHSEHLINAIVYKSFFLKFNKLHIYFTK